MENEMQAKELGRGVGRDGPLVAYLTEAKMVVLNRRRLVDVSRPIERDHHGQQAGEARDPEF